jgi:hypothetical protein
MGWLNQCDVPSGEKVDEHLRGFRMSGGCGYDGVGGRVNWAPGTGSSTQIGVGIYGGVSPGELSKKSGS